MTKRMLIISRRDDRSDYDTADSMEHRLSSVASPGLVYEACFLEEIVFSFDGQKLRATNMRNGHDMASYDGIFLLGWFKLRRHEDTALAISLYAETVGVPTLNTEARINRSRSKLSQQIIAVINKVRTGPFVIGIDKDQIAAKALEMKLAFPLIVKSASASRGDANYLVQDETELRSTLAQAPTKIFVMQPFIQNDGDYRLLVVNGAVQMAIHRKSQGESHLNNTSRGGKAELVALEELPQSMLDDAVTISQALHREVTGIDMIVDSSSGQHYFLEVNNMPQLSTGSFIEQKATMLDVGFRAWLNLPPKYH